MVDRNSYTIGWICALPIETAAATGMLDEKHPAISQPANDHNSYTLGRINGHNVAIACLPASSTGIAPAAAVGAQMLTAFPRLRFLLMVGVGGGVPSAGKDVRLGDVVISAPSDTYPGVIQYDSGKLLQDGEFQRTGSLSRPPEAILTTLTSLQSQHILEPPCLSRYVTAFIGKYPHLHDQVKNHGPEKDLLFESTYIHQSKDDSTCEACSPKYLKKRDSRYSTEPAIHYGLIASGNTLMRDSSKRDNLAKEFGVLCFEMEAAGLMNTFPCLVIRGICDYSDSHKNKIWQPYAAVTAAGFAKELLRVIPVETVSSVQLALEAVSMHNVRFDRNQKFTGRETLLKELESTLFGKIGATKVALFGLGGVGKTQVALELAHRMMEKHPDYPIFWVVGSSLSTLEQSYSDIATLLGIVETADKNMDLKQLVKQRLSHPKSGKWLIIVDNADDTNTWFNEKEDNDGEQALSKYLPVSTNGSFIFTTRDLRGALKMAPGNAIEIKELTNQAAIELFKTSLLRKDAIDSEEGLQKLISQLCHLPLALAQAIAFINANTCTVSTYLSLIAGTDQGFLEMLSENFEEHGRYEGSKNAVAATWLISFEQIKQQDPLAAKYLCLSSCFEPKHIPEIALEPEKQDAQVTKAFGTLMAYSFLSRNTKIVGTKLVHYSFFDVHRLVHLCVQNWLQAANEFQTMMKIATANLANTFPDQEHHNRALRATFLPHAYNVLDRTNDRSEIRGRINILSEVSSCLWIQGRYNDAEPFAKQAFQTAEKLHGEEHPNTLRCKIQLLSILSGRGSWKEVELLLEGNLVLTMRRVCGNEDPGTLIAMNNLSAIYRQLGRLDEAEALQTDVISMKVRVLGEEHPGTLLSMHNLAFIFLSQGKFKEAEKLALQVIEKQRRVLGEEHPEMLLGMCNLASTYYLQEKFEEAKKLQLQVIEKQRRVLGGEHPDMLTTMHDLASTYSFQGHLTGAEALFTQVLKLRRKTLGEEHPVTLTTKRDLARTLSSLGRTQEAIDLFESVYSSQLKVLGLEHPQTQLTLKRLSAYKAKIQPTVETSSPTNCYNA